MQNSNPLLDINALPRFSEIRPEHVEPAIRTIVAENRKAIDLLMQETLKDWDNFIQPLHNLNDRLEKAWSPVSHMNAVVQDDALRAAHDACLPELSAYHTYLGQHRGLFDAYSNIRESDAFISLSQAQKKSIDNALRDFRLSGIDLEEPQRIRYAEISARLSELGSQFSNHVLDATRAWSKHVVDESLLAGLPGTALKMVQSQAKAKQLPGFLLTLDAPCYIAIMNYADDRELRREMYEAYVTRASECGPNAGEFDNSGIITETLQLRFELATLLGFPSFADYSLATKMAESPQQVTDFLWNLVERSRSSALRDLQELRAFAAEKYGCNEIASWDIAWLSEKLREQSYAVDQEVLRQYFPLSKVLSGLFELISRLFGVFIEQEAGIDLWHPDAVAYRVVRGGNTIARFFTDFYARENKRGGAWMGDCVARRRLDDGSVQLPVAFLVCNFMPPAGDQPCLLSFDDVTTLFHEFGHGLHHMLTQVDCAPVSGINGVEWDAVELPSQFLENWCWQKALIPTISSHHVTGEPLSIDLLEKMLEAKNFQSGMQMLRQLEFALFDFILHWQYGSSQDLKLILDEIRSRASVFPPPSFNRFQNSFSHIFAGGYAAGYYSYKWAEVLSADAFAAFEETDILDDATSARFLSEMLERGGTEGAMCLFRRFRGRDPDVAALLRHSGLDEQEAA